MFVKLRSSEPLGQQIYQAFRRAILAGEMPPAGRLPSTRTLGLELGVSRNVVLLAYEQLLAEGYAEGRTGSGTYVAGALPETARAARPHRGFRSVGAARPGRLSRYGRRLAELPPPSPTMPPVEQRLPYDFRYGVPSADDFPHNIWRGIIARHTRAGSLDAMTYGPPEGHPPLREALAAYLRRARGVVCDPAQIIIVNGSQQALDLAARVLLDPGDHVVIEDPQYQGARRVFAAAGAHAVPVAVDVDGLDVARIPRRARRARLAYVTPSHQFPTGVVMSLARRLALLEWAERAGAYLVEDDYDSEYRYEGRPIEAVQGLDTRGPRHLHGHVLEGPVPRPATRIPRAASTPRRAVHRGQVADRPPHGDARAGGARRVRCRGTFRATPPPGADTNAARRKALLESLEEHLDDRVEIMGANAGVHLVVWLRDVPARGIRRVIANAAEAGVGVYPVAPYYIEPPRRPGFILGYASMTEREIRTGIGRLAAVVKAP